LIRWKANILSCDLQIFTIPSCLVGIYILALVGTLAEGNSGSRLSLRDKEMQNENAKEG